MYKPELENVFLLDSFYLESYEYAPNGDEFYLPDEGYLFLADFSLVYDVTKIDDGTVNGDNDAQIIVSNELLKYFAFHERNWYKIDGLVYSIYNRGRYKYVSSTRHIIIPPPLSLEDCTRKLFGVGTRYLPEWAQYNTDPSLCLMAYNAYYPTGSETPTDGNGNIINPVDVLPINEEP